MKPAPYESYLFRQTSTLSLGQLREARPRPLKGQPCSHIAILAAGTMCQCSLSGIRMYHSLARSAPVALSLSIEAQYWEPVEQSVSHKTPGALRRNGLRSLML